MDFVNWQGNTYTVDAFEEMMNEKHGKDHLKFHEKTEVGNFSIRLPRGSWDIMDALIPIILKYRTGDIVEIGMGESTLIFAEHAEKAGVMLHSCDIQMGGMFKVFGNPLFENHNCFIGKSEDFIKEYDGFPAIVFLDGEHRYETVKKEIDFFLPRLLPDGVIFLHDTMPVNEKNIIPDESGFNPGDVYKIRQELECNPDVDVFTWPFSAHNMGLTMIMKHDIERPYWRLNGRSC